METLPSESLAADYQFDNEKRLYDDTTTWLAEMLDGQMRTPFRYTFDGSELYSSDGTALRQIFKDSLRASEMLPPELAFEARRRQVEYEEYEDMIAMMTSNDCNTIVVVSDFPAELMNATEDIGGYNVVRKQTMLRVLTKAPDGTLHMRSQSLDGSDRRALEGLYTHLCVDVEPGELLGQRMHLTLEPTEQEFIVDELTGVYDRELGKLDGKTYYAGRERTSRQNTYDFVRAQTDLLALYTESAEKFGDNPDFLHDIAATMQKRYDAIDTSYGIVMERDVSYPNRDELLQEIISAGLESRQAGKTFSGCGLTLGEDSQTQEQQLSKLGYGNKSQEDKFGPLTFKCPRGHTNKRPRARSPKDFLTHCQKCGISVKC